MNSLDSVLRFALAIAGIAGGLCARADIEFVGVLATSRATHFALNDTTTGKTAWVERGATFSGWTIVSYDALFPFPEVKPKCCISVTLEVARWVLTLFESQWLGIPRKGFLPDCQQIKSFFS